MNTIILKKGELILEVKFIRTGIFLLRDKSQKRGANMGDNFEKSIVYMILKGVREINKFEINIDKLINKIENNEIDSKEIIIELKTLKHKIWGFD